MTFARPPRIHTVKVLLAIVLLGVAIYLIVRVIDTRGFSLGNRGPGRPPRPSRPVAPDDDEDFLRRLRTDRQEPGDQT